MAKYPAAFINEIAESGTKAEAVEYLQRQWDHFRDLMRLIEAEGYDIFIDLNGTPTELRAKERDSLSR